MKNGVLQTPYIIDAFQSVDRVNFVPKDFTYLAYIDSPLSIGYKQTISQPSTVAFMFELLMPRLGDKVLDVGSGSGYTTALLAHIVGKKGKVFGVEIIPELVLYGRKNLLKYNYPWADIYHAHKELGLPDNAPYDKILVSASDEQMPEELLQQLKVGGCLVVPVITSIWRIIRTGQNNFKKEEFPGFVFVPLKRLE